MSYQIPGPRGLNYDPCRYGTSRLAFRGPKRALNRPYVAFLGGTETYGKYIPRPFPALVEDRLQATCLNLGCVNAGPDVFLHDAVAMDLATAARACVVQITGAQNMSNRFYTVHPRRNDRFLKASRLMRQIFRDVDFTEFSFTRHMLDSLYRFAPERFEMVREELQEAWVARMRLMLQRFDGKAILLWFSEAAPPDDAPHAGIGPDPLFIRKSMLDALRDEAAVIVDVTAGHDARTTQGMVFPETEAAAAAGLLGPKAHEKAAAALVPVLQSLV